MEYIYNYTTCISISLLHENCNELIDYFNSEQFTFIRYAIINFLISKLFFRNIFKFKNDYINIILNFIVLILIRFLYVTYDLWKPIFDNLEIIMLIKNYVLPYLSFFEIHKFFIPLSLVFVRNFKDLKNEEFIFNFCMKFFNISLFAKRILIIIIYFNAKNFLLNVDEGFTIIEYIWQCYIFEILHCIFIKIENIIFTTI